MSTRNYISLGIMTGTSLDGVDLSLIESDGEKKVVFLAGDSYPFDKKLRESIKKILGSIKKNKQIISIEKKYTDFIIKKIKKFTKKINFKIDLIGIHGQTITHNPKKNLHGRL